MRRRAPIQGGGVIIHDDAAVENEDCIMNDAAPFMPVAGL
jgi:hypothetical protein